MGCRTSYPKSRLLRFVKGDGGRFVFDERGMMPGRGYYLCPTRRCFDAAGKNKKIKNMLTGVNERDDLSQTVMDTVTRSLETMLRRAPDCVLHDEILPGEGTIVVVNERCEGDEKRSFEGLASRWGAGLCCVPDGVMQGRRAVVVTKKTPRYSHLARVLWIHESLSSKGLS